MEKYLRDISDFSSSYIFKNLTKFNENCLKISLTTTAAFHTQRPGNYSICLSEQNLPNLLQKLMKYWGHFQHQLNNVLVRGDIHTQFITQNIKMTFSVQPNHPSLKTSCVTKYLLLQNSIRRYHRKQNNCKRLTYYTMITLFDQNWKYHNQNKKILHLMSQI